jgi:hypothetical protein
MKKVKKLMAILALLCLMGVCIGCTGDFGDDQNKENKLKETSVVPDEEVPEGTEVFDVTIKVSFRENLVLNKYDVNLLLNGKQKAAMAHGKGTEFVTKLAKGDYTMKFVKTDDTSVSGETTFTVDGETSVSVNIRTETDYVTVTKNDPSSEANKSGGNGNEGKKNEPKTIGINEEFGNKTITAVVTEVNLDFKDYSDYMVKVPEDSKMIQIVIKMTNISDKTNYVSVGDFHCYVDNVSVDAEMFTNSRYGYNDNIEPGRAAMLGACYIVPKNAESIELEYSPIGEKAERTIIKIK